MLLVRTVSGPNEVIAGTEAVYKATSFNISNPPVEELRQINWVIESNGETVAEFNRAGETLRFDVPESFIGKTIRVMPFRNTPTSVVSVISRVVGEDEVVTSNSNVTVLSRADWGARTDLPRRGDIVGRSRRTHVFIHHTVIIDNDSTVNEWEDMDEVKRQMRRLQTVRAQDLGADVPYSMVAFCMSNGDLVLGEGRGLDRSGAHTVGHNTAALGISFQGNFESSSLPRNLESQLAALGDWLRELRTQHGFVNLGSLRPLGREVFGHREVKSTDCPGENIFTRLRLIRFL
jgi:hypothetical protein